VDPKRSLFRLSARSSGGLGRLRHAPI